MLLTSVSHIDSELFAADTSEIQLVCGAICYKNVGQDCDQSDISVVFKAADILGVLQAISSISGEKSISWKNHFLSAALSCSP